ncbi:MAG TPA: hypothetical protein VGK37_11980 [Casimicrobiaceae bacterium]|jgi:hypothetical protein
MTEYVKAWQCIGCGRLEAPQTCIGVCRDQRVDFVYASDHEEVLTQLHVAQRNLRLATAVLRTLGSTTPHDDEWKRSYCALQGQAREALAAIDDDKLN